MFVGLRMLREFAPVTPETSVKDAKNILDESDLWMLLVVDKNEKLIGYVRKEDITAALPSVMTTLDKHEAKYLLSKLTVGGILRKDIITVSPEMEIEEAAQIMFDRNLAGLAVVDSGGNLLGYINRTVMLDVLIDEMGLRQGGERIVFEVEDRTGVLREALGIISDMGVGIISVSTFHHGKRRMVVVRLAISEVSSVAAALKEKGFRLYSAKDFSGEWLVE